MGAAIDRRSPQRAALAAALTVLVLVGGLWTAMPAHADDVNCTGVLGSQTVDNVQVPSGASCTMTGTQVEGNIIVGTGARLTASDVDVDGNIQAEGSAQVDVASSRVEGNIQIEQGGGARVRVNDVDGDIQVESNSGALDIDDNDVGGNVQAFSNSGGVSVTDNTVDGNLQCKSNSPAPTGGGNVVRGSAEDQCASLEGSSPGPGGGDNGAVETLRPTSRIAGADRFETAVEISKTAFPQGAPVVYLARADVAADALAAKSLDDGPLLLVPSCSGLPSSVSAEISRLDPQRVVALGGTGAVCQATLTEAGNVR